VIALSRYTGVVLPLAAPELHGHEGHALVAASQRGPLHLSGARWR
jgi:hypothetical protein